MGGAVGTHQLHQAPIQPSLSGLVGLSSRGPTLKRWAIFGCPSGTNLCDVMSLVQHPDANIAVRNSRSIKLRRTAHGLLCALTNLINIMKKLILSIIPALALALSAQAGDVSTKITGVHLCCPSCVKGVDKAVAEVPGVTAAASQDDGTVTLTGPDTATVQKAADALVAAG